MFWVERRSWMGNRRVFWRVWEIISKSRIPRSITFWGRCVTWLSERQPQIGSLGEVAKNVKAGRTGGRRGTAYCAYRQWPWSNANLPIFLIELEYRYGKSVHLLRLSTNQAIFRCLHMSGITFSCLCLYCGRFLRSARQKRINCLRCRSSVMVSFGFYSS